MTLSEKINHYVDDRTLCTAREDELSPKNYVLLVKISKSNHAK